MYDNTVRLIGFLGKDAEVKSTKSGNEYTVLSLATQASWKDKKSGEYVNRTEWHRMIAWANLSTFAATLKKGTHLSVEGELRYREFNDKKHKKVKGKKKCVKTKKNRRQDQILPRRFLRKQKKTRSDSISPGQPLRNRL